MKIFLTGATGFIGTHAAKGLTGQGHRLVCLARRTSSIQEIESLGADIVFGDVQDRRSVRPGMAGCDAMIHLAGATSFWEQDRESYSRINTDGTRNVMECALQAGIPRVVHVSTLYAYGKPAQKPFTEESTVGPVRFSEYARTKYEAERTARVLHAKKGLPLTVCAPATVLGARRPGGGEASFIKRLLAAVTVSRAFLDSVHTFVHVQDVVEALCRILDRPTAPGRSFFIAGERISIRRLLAMIEEISGAKLPRGGLSRPSARAVGSALTAVAGLLKRPPLMGLSRDYLATLREGVAADGSRAQRELGITYTPISIAVSDEIRSMDAEGLLSDKRRSRRYPLNIEVIYKAAGDKGPMPGYIVNISESGMFLATPKTYPRGSYISANLSGGKAGQYFMARGRVVRAAPGGIAIDFTHRDGNIRTLVEGLRKKEPPQPPA